VDLWRRERRKKKWERWKREFEWCLSYPVERREEKGVWRRCQDPHTLPLHPHISAVSPMMIAVLSARLRAIMCPLSLHISMHGSLAPDQGFPGTNVLHIFA